MVSLSEVERQAPKTGIETNRDMNKGEKFKKSLKRRAK